MNIVPGMMSPERFHGMSHSTYRWCVQVWKFARSLGLIDAEKKLNKWFPSSESLEMTALDAIVFSKFDEQAVPILICADRAFIRQENAVFYDLQFFHFVLSLLNEIQMEYYRHRSELLGI